MVKKTMYQKIVQLGLRGYPQMKMLEKENDRLKVADLSLHNAILKGSSGGKLVSPG